MTSVNVSVNVSDSGQIIPGGSDAQTSNAASISLSTPFSITYDSVVVPGIQYALFVDKIPGTGTDYGVTLDLADNTYGFFPGLVCRKGQSGVDWRYVLPYNSVMTFLFQGGVLDVYLDPTVAVSNIAPTDQVYKGGVLQSGISTIPAGAGSWAVLKLTQPYTLPEATDQILGGVKVGSNLSVTGGVLSVADASTQTAGVVKVGTNLSVASGVISVADATDQVAGVVKVGANLSVSNGVISGPAPYALPDATATVLGGIKIGTGFTTASGGVVSVDTSNIVANIPKASGTEFGIIEVGSGLTATSGKVDLDIATASALGGVKAGTTLSIESDGTINYDLPKATASVLGGIKQGTNVTVESDGTLNVATGAGYVLPKATAAALGGVIVSGGLDVDASGDISTKIQTLFRKQTWDFVVGGSTEPDIQTIYDYVIKGGTLKPNSRLEFSFILNDPTDAANINADGSFKFATKDRGVRLLIKDQTIINDVIGSPGLAGFNLWTTGTTDAGYDASRAPYTFLKYEVLGTIWVDDAGKAMCRVNYNGLPPATFAGSQLGEVFALNVDFTVDQHFTIFADFKAQGDKIFFGHCELTAYNA